MPRTARIARRERHRRRRVAAVVVIEVARPVPEHGRAYCLGCGCQVPTTLLTSSGHCPTCSDISAIERDHRGGLSDYQRREHYAGLTTFHGGHTDVETTATAKPSVGNGDGPAHYLDTTPIRPSELDLPAGLYVQRYQSW